MCEDINDYLKDGETPLDAIKRERRSTDNLLRHLADAKQRIEELESLVMLAYKEGYSDGHVGSDDGLTEVRKHLGEETPQ